MSTKLCTVLLSLLALAVAAPAFAGQAAAPAPAVPALAQAAPADCGGAPALELPGATAPVCKAQVTPAGGITVAAPEFLVTYHGYCRCGCRRVPDCNTDADCGGGRCLGGVTCC